LKNLVLSWPAWALLSAFFAALTAIFGKLGVEQINSDFATFLRTVIVLVVLGLIVALTGAWQPLGEVSRRTYIFLALSALATGASWLCYYRALQLGPASAVAPIDKLSLVLVAVLAFTFLGERLAPAGWLGVGLMGSGAVLLALRA